MLKKHKGPNYIYIIISIYLSIYMMLANTFDLTDNIRSDLFHFLTIYHIYQY